MKAVRIAVLPLVFVAGCAGAPLARAPLLEGVAAASIADGTIAAVRAGAAVLDAALVAWRARGDLAAQARGHATLADARGILDETVVADGHRRQAERLFMLSGDADRGFRQRVLLVEDCPLDGEPLRVALAGLAATAHARGYAAAEVTAQVARAASLVRDGQSDQALAALDAVQAMIDPVRDDAAAVGVALNLGIAYYNAGDAARALEHLGRGRTLALARGDNRTAAELRALTGMVELNLQNHAREARADLEPALAALERMGMVDSARQTRAQVAMAATALGDYPAAIRALEPEVAAVRAEGDRAALARSLESLGRAYRASGRLTEARAAYAEEHDLGVAIHNPFFVEGALIGRARVDLADQRWDDARAGAEQFLTTVAERERAQPEARLKLSYSGATRAGQGVLLEAYASAGDATRAFLVSEAMRGRYLIGALAGADNAGATVTSIAEAQAALPPDTALVEYTFADRTAWVFVLDRDHLTMRALGASAPIADAATALYKLLADRDASPAALAAARTALATRVIAPIADELHRPRLAIALDAVLAWLPFGVLPLPDGTALLADHELVEVGSASVLRAGAHRPPRRRATLALAILADPLFLADDRRVAAVATRDAAGPFVRLPATRAEASRLAALVPPGAAWVALDADASVAAMRGPEVGAAAIVHIATHSQFDPDDPDRNGLVLAQVDATGARVADGFLAADEVAQLDLAADLVVLSACHTGVGTSYSGEGIAGLTRAFEARGVPRVVSSLWQVDDASTTELMVRFYQGMLRDRLRPEAALRRAQLEVAADPRFAAPYHWAAFALHGQPSP